MKPKYYVKHVDTGMVLDIPGDAETGKEVCLWTPHGGDNQLWKYKDSMLYSVKDKTLVLDVNEETRNVCLWPANGGTNQLWTFCDDNTCNSGTGDVMDVRKGRRDAGAGICVWAKHGGPNQQFVLVEK